MDPSATFTDCQVHQRGGASFPHECHNDTRDAVQDLEKQIHERHNYGWRKIVLNFTPSWFSVNMGTGIVSILLHNLPYNGRWLYWISVSIFCLNVFLFIIFLTISVFRYLMYKGLFMSMIRHPVQSLFANLYLWGRSQWVWLLLSI